MSDAEYYKARAAVCRIAVDTADKHPDLAADIVRGAMAGFVLSASHFDGWDAVLDHVRQLAAASRVPATAEKFSPVVYVGGKA
jgi:hypothetical protein